MKKIPLLIVDDHFFVRSGLAASLGSEPDLLIVGEAENVSTAITQFQALRPLVTLLDLRLGEASGLDALRAIRALSPSAGVLIFSVEETEEDLFRSHEAGAMGYLSKAAPLRLLLAAIRAIAGGKRCFSPAAEALIRARKAQTGLSAREIEVLHLIVEGLSNKLIAGHLGIAENTVKVHVARLLEKLDAPDRTAAARQGVLRGLVRF